jgi:hypothetical protein
MTLWCTEKALLRANRLQTQSAVVTAWDKLPETAVSETFSGLHACLDSQVDSGGQGKASSFRRKRSVERLDTHGMDLETAG